MKYNMYIPGTIIYIKYIKYELYRKYRTYLFKVFMASAVVHISKACILAQKIMPYATKALFTGSSHPFITRIQVKYLRRHTTPYNMYVLGTHLNIAAITYFLAL